MDTVRGRSSPTPLTVTLPFNIGCLGDSFVPAKNGAEHTARTGYWLIVQDQGLILEGAEGSMLPRTVPAGLEAASSPPLLLGTWNDLPCWTSSLPKDVALPAGFRRETLVPMQNTTLPDDLLTLGGMAMQLLWWESTSDHCPRCGAQTRRIPGEWGKECPACRYQHYPHLHPAVIVLVHDGDRVLLARKAGWVPGRYALVAGFVDNGESLEAAVRREVKEEVGVEVDEITYVGSQNWPFPSQLMLGFLARYAGGEVTPDPTELEDARWFPRDALPNSPTHHSIAGFIIKNYAAVS
ncbi:MAG TPA: NAD(+) diphosphatase [Chloroflexota bacterium]